MRMIQLSRITLTSISCAAILIIAACGGPAQPEGNQPDIEGEVPSASSESLKGPAQDEGKLVWYTSNTRPAADALAKNFEDKYPGIDVDIFQAGGSQVIAKVESEAMAGGIKADLVDYSEGAAAFDQAKRGLFQRYLPPNIDQIADNLYDENGFWMSPWYLTSTIVYNTDLLSEDEAPHSWAELTKPKWQGKVGMGSPDYAGTAVTTVAAWQQEFGDDYIETIGHNGMSVLKGFGDVHEAVLSGQTPVGVNLSFRALVAEDKGEPIDWINPDEGQILLSFASAIPKTAKHPNAAKLFSNFLLTDEVQEMVANDIRYFPGRTEFAKEAGMPDTAEMKLITPDLTKLADSDYISDVKKLFDSSTS